MLFGFTGIRCFHSSLNRATGRHLGCNQKFPCFGTGQEFIQAWFLSDIHFDDDERFTAPNTGSGISLLKERFWRYDNENDQVFRQDSEGHQYPRLIPEGFPGVPSPIDTALDSRDTCMYSAWKPKAWREAFPKNIRDVFPPVESGDLPAGNIDACLLFPTAAVPSFLLEDTRSWRAEGSRRRPRGSFLPRNGPLPHTEVDLQRFDICDVHPTALGPTR
ncbi:LOW QUALITY PROTEIN: matrix metallopeptidase-21 [Menidia menidia]